MDRPNVTQGDRTPLVLWRACRLLIFVQPLLIFYQNSETAQTNAITTAKQLIMIYAHRTRRLVKFQTEFQLYELFSDHGQQQYGLLQHDLVQMSSCGE